MHTLLKKAALVAALATASASAQATEAHVSVWAYVDTTLSLLRADGSALPDVVEMAYRAGQGLSPHIEEVRIFSNDTDKDVEVRLGNAAALLPTLAPVGAAPVPLTVSLNGRALTTTSTDFTAAELFNGSIPGASIMMPLRIAQTTPGAISHSGLYEGIVSLALNQKTAAP